ncbi:hypothetical protein Nm8I071_39800 [Nonomuraea sp. TT08I-71]|nr:hypothetical protein Nm8I071_39800 [Nonomuraea sp. TT08I-71]
MTVRSTPVTSEVRLLPNQWAAQHRAIEDKTALDDPGLLSRRERTDIGTTAHCAGRGRRAVSGMTVRSEAALPAIYGATARPCRAI